MNGDLMFRDEVYTIGYGGRTLEDVVEHLQKYKIQFLIDVRTTPFSRFQPEFSKEPLLHILEKHSIRYVFMGDLLGGRPEDDDCYKDGKVDYEKCEGKDFFKKGIARVKNALSQGLNICILCSEGKPWMCHRSKLIGKVLSDDGIDVRHLLSGDKICTQKEAINEINGGQHELFGEQFTSRKSYKVDMKRVVTIGGYGFDQEGFISALKKAKVDIFVDIRQRRGVRGSKYSFLNSNRLQTLLAEAGIKYIYIRELAPTDSIREMQKNSDFEKGELKRKRTQLSQEFVRAYENEVLENIPLEKFFHDFIRKSKTIAFFCVETKPEACHRSIVAKHVHRQLGVSIEHIYP